MRLPRFSGAPIRVEIVREMGSHLAGSDIRQRKILLASELMAKRGEFERILIHELFHFVWVRLGNARRLGWERVLAAEFGKRARGELGWSAESRKHRLKAADGEDRSGAWRRYVCESFCDTAAWLYSNLRTHDEFTLAARYRTARARWFEQEIASRVLPL